MLLPGSIPTTIRGEIQALIGALNRARVPSTMLNARIPVVPQQIQRSGPFQNITFLFCPTGRYCRENRCQSFFDFSLIPSMRAPLEECEAAGAIRAGQGVATLIDGPAENFSDQEFLNAVEQSASDLFVVVATFGSLAADLVWVKRLRVRFPDVAIAIRGAPVYVSASEILASHPQIDFCVKGDYELVFAALVEKPYREVPGVLHMHGSQFVENERAYANALDELPLPDRTVINEKLYVVRGTSRPQATVHVQRGCPYSCTYCLVHTVSGKKARHRSPEHIVRELQLLQENGIGSVYLRAETFTLDRDWALSLCRAISEGAPGLRWVTTTRVETVDEELLVAMKKAGCYGISFGVDVLSEEIADKVRKPLSMEAAERAFLLCRKHGILSLAYVMIGFYWETEATLLETRAAVKKFACDLLTIHFAHPYPGTRYARDITVENPKIISLRAQAEPAIVTPFVSKALLERAARAMLLRHYLAPLRLLRITYRFSRILRR